MCKLYSGRWFLSLSFNREIRIPLSPFVFDIDAGREKFEELDVQPIFRDFIGSVAAASKN